MDWIYFAKNQASNLYLPVQAVCCLRHRYAVCGPRYPAGNLRTSPRCRHSGQQYTRSRQVLPAPATILPPTTGTGIPLGPGKQAEALLSSVPFFRDIVLDELHDFYLWKLDFPTLEENMILKTRCPSTRAK